MYEGFRVEGLGGTSIGVIIAVCVTGIIQGSLPHSPLPPEEIQRTELGRNAGSHALAKNARS